MMNREYDYRTKAAESLHRALRATSTADKRRLLGMAEAWLELADRVHKVAEPRMRDEADHPLVRSKLTGKQSHAERTDCPSRASKP